MYRRAKDVPSTQPADFPRGGRRDVACHPARHRKADRQVSTYFTAHVGSPAGATPPRPRRRRIARPTPASPVPTRPRVAGSGTATSAGTPSLWLPPVSPASPAAAPNTARTRRRSSSSGGERHRARGAAGGEGAGEDEPVVLRPVDEDVDVPVGRVDTGDAVVALEAERAARGGEGEAAGRARDDVGGGNGGRRAGEDTRPRDHRNDARVHIKKT